ncbi:MAG: hypothetical protein ACQEP1_04240 [Nanobdellota archaeon]
MRTAYLLIIITLISIAGCAEQDIGPEETQQETFDGEKRFEERINNTYLKGGYEIKVYKSSPSSGGSKEDSETRIIKRSELENITEKIRKMELAGSFETAGRECYYSGKEGPNHFVCFSEHRIVNYIEKDGREYYRWNKKGSGFDIGRSVLIDKGVKECKMDSDCTLTTKGVCDPENRCEEGEVGCDSGCRTAINSEKAFAWSFVPYKEDECLHDECIDGEGSFEAVCMDNSCMAKIVD